MGRYYSGDINGKFWCGIQPSYDADHFGITYTEPNYIEYYFDENDLQKVEKGIYFCEYELKEHYEKMKKFFEKKTNHTEKELAIYLNIPIEKIKKLLEYYARLILGIKIRNCIIKQGSCEFEAEL